MKRRVSVRGIVYKDDTILCVRLKPYNTSIHGEFWCTPGGSLEPAESLQDGLYREMMEETGVAPIIGPLLYIQQFVTDDEVEHLEFLFHVTNADDYATIDLANTSHGAIEIEKAQFIDPTKETDVRPAFLMTEPIGVHIERAEPPKIFNFISTDN